MCSRRDLMEAVEIVVAKDEHLTAEFRTLKTMYSG